MAKKRPAKRVLLSREGRISGWSVDVLVVASESRLRPRERAGSLSLRVRGRFTEPVKGVADFSILLVCSERVELGRSEIPSVGSMLKAKPVLDGFVSLTETEYSALLTLASAGQLAYCWCSFQEPRYGSGLIDSLMFATAPSEAKAAGPQSAIELGSAPE